LHLPNFGPYGDVRTLAALARDAQEAGWDGVFLWDHVLFCDLDRNPHADPWVALTAMAAVTDRVLLGPLATPLSRRRPWQVARQAVSLQDYSGGRLVLGVGLGAPVEWDFRFFGEETDDRVRAERLDEGLAILRGLWSGEEFSFNGRHHRLAPMTFLPRPSRPIPIWVAGSWPRRRPFVRAARFDGVMPMATGATTPATVREMARFVAAHRPQGAPPFDVVVSGESAATPESYAADVAPYEGVATWWLEGISPLRLGLDWPALADPWDTAALRRRILDGPPRP
jgi:alkanesulfonate monooxygenase SsuD/methylene tetrahydromethanopterin reductase-like flavin-dependent oxidoreductase (luciferase family)